MGIGIVTATYIASSVLFILALGGLSNQEKAKRAVWYGIIGMALAVLATVLGPGMAGWSLVLLIPLLAITLEFSPTVISLILAGKVGSNIASSLGTMRVSEQIDALEVMGVNSASFLILPKIVAQLLFNPILIILSIALGLWGGYMVGGALGLISFSDTLIGYRMEFMPFYTFYALIKTVAYAFIIGSISAYCGYTVKGGAVEVGVASTNAVVRSCLAIILANYVLTDLILNA